MTRLEKVLAEPEIPAHDAVTMEGLPAYSRSKRESYLQMLMTNTFGQAFYASAEELVAESLKLHAELAGVDPDWALKAAVYAREKGYMRSQPILALAHCARRVSREAFEDSFNRIIQTPKDLAEFTASIRKLRKGEGGRRIKRTAGQWLAKRLSPYWAIKYGAEREKGQYSLRDLLCVYHPRFPEKSPMVDWLLNRADMWAATDDQGMFVGAYNGPTPIAAFEVLKRAKTEEAKVRAIEAGRLPHEVASSFAGTSPKVWAAIAEQAPIFALLRHLATLERHGCLDACRDRIRSVFTSAEHVAKSKILPFRFLDALEKVKEGWLRDTLRDAAELALRNVRVPAEPCAIFVDISSSMQNRQSVAASLFAVAMAKAGEKVGVYVYNERIKDFSVSKRDSILTQAKAMVNLVSGGTATHLCTEALLSRKAFFNTMVLISDEQQNIGTTFYANLVRYRATVNPQFKCFIVNVAPYSKSGGLAPSDDPLTYWLYGWSDKIVDFVSLASGDGFRGAAASI